jgi:hypothetical protein
MYIHINTLNRYWTPGQRLLKANPELQQYFCQYMALEYQAALQRAILTQRFRNNKWLPLSPAYLQYKEKMGFAKGIWIRTGQLVDSIIVLQRGDHWMVGIDPTANYPGAAGIPVLTIAKFMEFGTTKMPARPLFRPIANYLNAHISRYFQMFIKGNPDLLAEPAAELIYQKVKLLINQAREQGLFKHRPITRHPGQEGQVEGAKGYEGTSESEEQ